MLLTPILPYNLGMLDYCEIHPDMGCPLIPKSLKIPRQTGYLTQYYEASDVHCKSINVSIENVYRLLCRRTHPSLLLLLIRLLRHSASVTPASALEVSVLLFPPPSIFRLGPHLPPLPDHSLSPPHHCSPPATLYGVGIAGHHQPCSMGALE